MPMPKPKKNEEKQEFVSRCIADVTKKDKDKYPSVEQRAAICYSEWGETPEEKEQAVAKKKRSKKKSS